VGEIISHVDDVSDGGLDSLALEPWLSDRVVKVSVGSEEGIEASELIELNVELVGWLSIEAWDVRTSVGVSSDSKLHNLGHTSL